MISANQIRKGIAIKYRDDMFEIVEFQHVKPGKGGAFVKMKLKSFTTGRVLEDTVRPEDKIEDVFLEDKPMEYLYNTGDKYVFMDLKTYEQVELDKVQVEHVIPYMKENMEVSARGAEGKLYSIALPNSVELQIVDTAPNHKGDTNTGGKPATLETGAVVQVPFFISNEEVIRVDTRTGEYLGRSKE